MYTKLNQEFIRVLVADDDESVLECYLDALAMKNPPIT